MCTVFRLASISRPRLKPLTNLWNENVYGNGNENILSHSVCLRLCVCPKRYLLQGWFETLFYTSHHLNPIDIHIYIDIHDIVIVGWQSTKCRWYLAMQRSFSGSNQRREFFFSSERRAGFLTFYAGDFMHAPTQSEFILYKF